MVLYAIGAPEEIRTPDPQIRSLVRTVEIIEVRYRKLGIGGESTDPSKNKGREKPARISLYEPFVSPKTRGKCTRAIAVHIT